MKHHVFHIDADGQRTLVDTYDSAVEADKVARAISMLPQSRENGSYAHVVPVQDDRERTIWLAYNEDAVPPFHVLEHEGDYEDGDRLFRVTIAKSGPSIVEVPNESAQRDEFVRELLDVEREVEQEVAVSGFTLPRCSEHCGACIGGLNGCVKGRT